MRYLILLLFFSLPCTAGATIAAPIPQGETAIAQQAIPHGFAPKSSVFSSGLQQKSLQNVFTKR
ncbi:MAG: hypothetical protein ACKV1O_12365 [Saprospiraceae bacterium]